MPQQHQPKKTFADICNDLTPADARDMLQLMDPDCPRDEWYKLACACKDAGLEAEDFHSWSSQSDKYKRQDTNTTWRGIKPGKITSAFLVGRALQKRWQAPERPSSPPARPPARTMRKPRKAAKEPVKLTPEQVQAEWDKYSPASMGHCYIERKRGWPTGLRVCDRRKMINKQDVKGWLVVPMRNLEGQLTSLQYIPPLPEKGDAQLAKLNLPKGIIKGSFHIVGDSQPGDEEYIVEGIGHAWTLNRITHKPVRVAFGFYNIERTIEASQAQQRRPVLVPDRDKIDTPEKLKHIEDMARRYGIPWCPLPAGTESDINDIEQAHGEAAVLDIVARAVTPPPPRPEIADAEAIAGRILASTGLQADMDILTVMLSKSFWSAGTAQLSFLNRSDDYVRFPQTKAMMQLQETYGDVVPMDRIKARAREKTDDEKKVPIIIKALQRAISDAVIDYIQLHRQREAIEWSTDMFAQSSSINMLEHKAGIVFTHRNLLQLPAVQRIGRYRPEVVADFKQHFPRFDEFLTLAVMARFASDRKAAYLWIHAQHDWGKGVLYGILKSLGLAVKASVPEIEAMFQGKPVGLDPRDLARAMVLVINEFKTIRTELKELESEIQLAPKHMLRSSAPVYLKLFLSAENVDSLGGSEGVEEQYGSRFSLFQETGNIKDRPLFDGATGVGQNAYVQSLTVYAAEIMQRQITELQAKGKTVATKEADDWITDFHTRRGITNFYGSSREAIPRLALEIFEWITRPTFDDPDLTGRIKVVTDPDDPAKQRRYLQSPKSVIKTWLSKRYDRSESATYQHWADAIARAMSHDGKGIHPYWIPGIEGKPARVIKAVLLTDTETERAIAWGDEAPPE